VPRVVPSQAVAVIDRMFTWAAAQSMNPDSACPMISLRQLGQIVTILNLVRQVPEELLPLDSDRHMELLAGVSSLEAAVEAWQGGNKQYHVVTVPGFGPLHAVTLVRRALASCSDEAPSPKTTQLPFIGDQALRDSIRLDMSTAHQDLAEGEWKGATVLAGSAVEALLLWALQEHETQNAGARAGAIAALRGSQPPVLTRQPDANPERWDLHEYVEVAAQLGIIAADTAAQTRLARRFRDLIHPGRAQRLGQKCDRATAHGAIASVEAVARDLTPP